MYSGIYASVDLPPLFVVVPVACTLGDDAGRRIPIVCGHKKYLRSCPRKYSSMIRDNFLFVDLAQLFEQFAERSLDFAAQRCKVLAHQRRIMCIGRIVGLDEKRVAKSPPASLRKSLSLWSAGSRSPCRSRTRVPPDGSRSLFSAFLNLPYLYSVLI